MQSSATHLLATDLVDFDPQVLINELERLEWKPVRTVDAGMVAYQRPGGRDSVLDTVMFGAERSDSDTRLFLLANAIACFGDAHGMSLLQTLRHLGVLAAED